MRSLEQIKRDLLSITKKDIKKHKTGILGSVDMPVFCIPEERFGKGQLENFMKVCKVSTLEGTPLVMAGHNLTNVRAYGFLFTSTAVYVTPQLLRKDGSQSPINTPLRYEQFHKVTMDTNTSRANHYCAIHFVNGAVTSVYLGIYAHYFVEALARLKKLGTADASSDTKKPKPVQKPKAPEASESRQESRTSSVPAPPSAPAKAESKGKNEDFLENCFSAEDARQEYCCKLCGGDIVILPLDDIAWCNSCFKGYTYAEIKKMTPKSDPKAAKKTDGTPSKRASAPGKAPVPAPKPKHEPGEESYRKAMAYAERTMNDLYGKVILLEQSSREGYIPAMLELGRIYLYKKYVGSKAAGLQTLCTAAGLGSQEAVHMLQDYYRAEDVETGEDKYGEGDYERALAFAKLGMTDKSILYLQNAAQKCHPKAIYRMGMLHLDRKRDSYDPEYALKCFQLAEKLGNPDATEIMKEIRDSRPDSELRKQVEALIKEAEKAALNDENERMVELLEKAAELGSIDAHIMLGKAFLYGIGVACDYKKTLYHYTIVAESGSAEAMVALGRMYSYGQGSPKNPKESIRWYGRAAQLGDTYGMVGLARNYFRESEVKDLEKAAYWAKKAYELGDSAGTHYLMQIVTDPKEKAFWKARNDEFMNSPVRDRDIFTGEYM